MRRAQPQYHFEAEDIREEDSLGPFLLTAAFGSAIVHGVGQHYAAVGHNNNEGETYAYASARYSVWHPDFQNAQRPV
jgi:hypothetical protein